MRGDFEAFHRGLQRVDRIDLGDDDARAEAAERMRAAFADIAVAADDGDFAGDHDVERALDAVGERFAAAVEIVELRFGDGVVHVDGGDEQLALLRASGRGDARRWSFLRKRRSIPSRLRASDTGFSRFDFLEQVLDDLLFVAVDSAYRPSRCLLRARSLVDEQRDVAAVIDDELRAFVAGERERLIGASQYSSSVSPFQAKTGMPAFAMAAAAWSCVEKMLQLAQRTSAPRSTSVSMSTAVCDGHVQRTGDAHALERLVRRRIFCGWTSGRAFPARRC